MLFGSFIPWFDAQIGKNNTNPSNLLLSISDILGVINRIFLSEKVCMTLEQILKDDVFTSAVIKTPLIDIAREVSSVMVLEAADIEKWGRKDQLILTSYYALKELTPSELESFFQKVVTIGISGILIKLQRLIDSSPVELVELCSKHNIPLIELSADIKYESVLLAVFQPIIYENSKMLDAYYSARKSILSVSNNELSIDDLVMSLQNILHEDFQFETLSKKVFFASHGYGSTYDVIESTIQSPRNYVENTFYELQLQFENSRHTVTRVALPDVVDEPYFLTLFQSYSKLSDQEIMLVENVVEMLVNKLLRLYQLKRNQAQRKNNQTYDLLLSRYYSVEERNSILQALQIDTYSYYQGIMANLLSDTEITGNPFTPLLDWVKEQYTHYAYFIRGQELIIILNFASKDKQLTVSRLQPLLRQYQKRSETGHLHLGISAVHKSGLEPIHDQLVSVKKFMQMVHKSSFVMEYDALGFFKLFNHVESLSEFKEFVPQHIMELVEDKPEFALTLLRFIENHHNYVKTAERTFLHPKTIRYRVAKVSESLDLDLDDGAALLNLHVALKICEVLGLFQDIT